MYTFVFRYIFELRSGAGPTPYAVFLFTGLLPWTWFQASVLEATSAILGGGALLKKVVFPAEVLPLVTVLANSFNFLFALPILVAVLLLTGHVPGPRALLVLPLMAIQTAAHRRPGARRLRPHGALPRRPRHPRSNSVLASTPR